METNQSQNTLLEHLRPGLEKTPRLTKIWYAFLGLFILVGLYGLYLQFTEGQIVTGMRDHVVWGFYGVNFLFLMGISYSGAFMSAVLHFVDTPLKRPVVRIVEIMTVLTLAVGPLFIFLCMGRLDRLHYLFMYPRIQSPITWDVIAITTDLIGCFIYLYLTFIPDMAILRDRQDLKVPNWRKKLYRSLSLGYQDTPRQRRRLHRITRGMSAMIIIMAIAVYTVMAWIFSLTLQPGWNSTIFASYFIVSGIFSGLCVIIISMYILRRVLGLEKYLTEVHFRVGGFVMLISALLFGYFTFSEYFAKWYSNKSYDIQLLDALFNRYFWTFIFANYIGVIVPVVVVGIRKLRTVKMISFAAFISFFSVWFNRYLIVVPTLENPYIPIQDSRMDYIFYSPTWVEYALTLAGVALILLLFTLIVKWVPVIPIHELQEEETYPVASSHHPEIAQS